MSKISFYGIESGSPYAVVDGSDKHFARFGVKQLFGHDLLPQLGVDMALARAQMVPGKMHNLTEEYMKQSDDPSLTIAALGLISNSIDHPGLAHSHPILEGKFEGYIEDTLVRYAHHGAMEMWKDLEQHPDKYGDKTVVEEQMRDIQHFKTILESYSRDPRKFIVTSNNSLIKVKAR